MARRTPTQPPDRPLRRSPRLSLSPATTKRADAEQLAQQTFPEQTARNAKIEGFRLLQLPEEVRRLMFSYLVTTERPFLVGRCQEKPGGGEGSPRDFFTRCKPSKFRVQRNEEWNRPIQPPITRVCQMIRQEALPLWYSINDFWLIHNEFEPGSMAELQSPPPKGFEPWVSQTPRDRFDHMERVSLCGYGNIWPNRTMITLDLKHKRVVQIRRYSTLGQVQYNYEPPATHEPPYGHFIQFSTLTEQALASKRDEDGFTVLMAVVAIHSDLFRIPHRRKASPPNLMRDRQPAAGWEYDW